MSTTLKRQEMFIGGKWEPGSGGEFQDNFQKLRIDAAHMELARVYYVLGRIEEGDREMRSVKPGLK